MKTFSPKPADIDRQWFIVDADGKILGRLASMLAHRLRGKHKPEFAPHMDNGDFIVVVNCDKIKVTGTKLAKKKYYNYSGYVGGLKETTLETMLASRPSQVLLKAVKGMLPRNSLGRALLRKLKVYAGNEHPHAAQNPTALSL
jgi:large subunit ribosomal protein L13